MTESESKRFRLLALKDEELDMIYKILHDALFSDSYSLDVKGLVYDLLEDIPE